MIIKTLFQRGLDKTPFLLYNNMAIGVWLSLARAPALGAGRRRFESCHPDQQRNAAPLSPLVRSRGDFFAREGLFLALIAAPNFAPSSARGGFFPQMHLLTI